MNDLENISIRAKSLVVFRKLLQNEAIRAFLAMVESCPKDEATFAEAYASFAHILFQHTENWTAYLWRLITLDVNTYVYQKAHAQASSPMLEQCVANELTVLQAMAQTCAADIKRVVQTDVFLPEWETDDTLDFCTAYQTRMRNIATIGYGIYAENTMFTYQQGAVLPVKLPDTISLASLTGYEAERQLLIDNTLAFLQGRPAANALLYGDAGTGKSSTVKAVVHEYAIKGLRMIEVRKGQLLEMPGLIEQLGENPLKFILFIDDLSFAQNNEEIGALKAILEGSVSAKSSNVVIYATSNRRHIVRETFSQRSGDDIHLNETIQEQTSLSERFGLSIRFAKPSKDQYLTIVHALAREYGMEEIENIDLLAEQHAIERGGRSGRVARQFVERLKTRS